MTSEELILIINNSDFQEEIINSVPDTYQIDNPQNLKNLVLAKQIILAIKIVFYSLIFLSVILLGLLCYLGRSWWPAIPRWVGLSLLLPSGVFLIINLITKSIPLFVISQPQNLDQEITNLLEPLINTVGNSLNQWALNCWGVIFIIGCILIILSYLLPHPEDPQKPAKITNPTQPKP